MVIFRTGLCVLGIFLESFVGVADSAANGCINLAGGNPNLSSIQLNSLHDVHHGHQLLSHQLFGGGVQIRE